MPRELECENCKRPVNLGSDRERFAEMNANDFKPLCRVCRRMARHASGEVHAGVPGVARKRQGVSGPNLLVKGLVQKQGVRAKRRRMLASHALSRIGESGSVVSVAVGE